MVREWVVERLRVTQLRWGRADVLDNRVGLVEQGPQTRAFRIGREVESLAAGGCCFGQVRGLDE